MISLDYLEINNKIDLNKLLELIPKSHIDDKSLNKIKSIISDNTCTLAIEYPYYDKDYLSTYYIFYSKKVKVYPKECYRIHIVKDEYYQGYFILRPTCINKLGRAYFEPAFINKDMYLMLSDFKVNLLGKELIVKAFPWISQETDVSVCAHVALLDIIRYYGNRFKNHADKRMGDVIACIPSMTNRQVPTEYLTAYQMAEVLRKSLFTPLMLKPADCNDAFIEYVFAYVESGIPVLAFIKNHAITIIGHGKIDMDHAKLVYDKADTHINTSGFINELIVQDDNYSPYQLLQRDESNANGNRQLYRYLFSEIELALVPLYDRMYLTYKHVNTRVKTLLDEKFYKFPKKACYRVYITSSNSLKREALKSNSMNEKLKGIIVKMVFPKFVWCVDISEIYEYNNSLTSARIIIDTTENTHEENPWQLIHDKEKIVFIDEHGKWTIEETSIEPYANYVNNLKHIS